MSYYRDHLLPHIQNRIMDNKMMRDRRRLVCEPLEGDVIEIGFGSGLNVPHYPSAVTGVWAVDPSEQGFRLAERRLSASTTPVIAAGLDGARLELPDDRFDAALSTWTLCTISDVTASLAELRRVLKPGARFHFVEHGHSPDPKVDRWQHRLEPTQKRLAGGCHLTRDIPALIEAAGFVLEHVDTSYEKATPKSLGHTFQGVARNQPAATTNDAAAASRIGESV